MRPSDRLGAPLPADLEEVILTCLAKRPENRPATAADLAARLARCADAAAWTEADARRWWSQHGAELARLGRHTAAAAGPGAVTIAIDVDARTSPDSRPR